MIEKLLCNVTEVKGGYFMFISYYCVHLTNKLSRSPGRAMPHKFTGLDRESPALLYCFVATPSYTVCNFHRNSTCLSFCSTDLK